MEGALKHWSLGAKNTFPLVHHHLTSIHHEFVIMYMLEIVKAIRAPPASPALLRAGRVCDGLYSHCSSINFQWIRWKCGLWAEDVKNDAGKQAEVHRNSSQVHENTPPRHIALNCTTNLCASWKGLVSHQGIQTP
jgi:hypothetical protein